MIRRITDRYFLTPRARDERGAAAIFVLSLSVVLLLVAGLVIDGGVAINARMRVADDAEQAARVGADSVDLNNLRAGGGVQVDPSLAQRRATQYLAKRGYAPGQVEIFVAQNGTVDVYVRDSSETIFLSIVNMRAFTVGAGASAAPRMQ